MNTICWDKTGTYVKILYVYMRVGIILIYAHISKLNKFIEINEEIISSEVWEKLWDFRASIRDTIYVSIQFNNISKYRYIYHTQ